MIQDGKYSISKNDSINTVFARTMRGTIKGNTLLLCAGHGDGVTEYNEFTPIGNNTTI